MLVKSKVKYIQSLSQKKFRDDEGVFVAEGPKIVNELLSAREAEPVEIYATESWMDRHSALTGAFNESAFTVIKASELERISFLSTPNEVAGIFKKPSFHLKNNAGLILMLDNIQDPGNLGTIIRCADWFGIHHVICSPGSADNFGPKVVQSSMTSVVRVEVTYTNLVEYIQLHPDHKVYAAALDGKPVKDLQPVRQAILVIGNESKGISPEVMEMATERITIPRLGRAESLNASVATGILLSYLASPV